MQFLKDQASVGTATGETEHASYCQNDYDHIVQGHPNATHGKGLKRILHILSKHGPVVAFRQAYQQNVTLLFLFLFCTLVCEILFFSLSVSLSLSLCLSVYTNFLSQRASKPLTNCHSTQFLTIYYLLRKRFVQHILLYMPISKDEPVY